jgi:hypothetical protein
MLNRFSATLFFVVILALTGCGGGTNILNDQSQYTVRSGNVTLDRVTRAIITASATKGWKPSVAGPGHIVAARRNSGYSAKVDIIYTTSSFTIQYLSSDNMDYDGKHISPVYNQWIGDLRSEIKFRLSEL